jgi:hypothetical protein
MVEKEQAPKNSLWECFVFLSRKKGRKALADIAAAAKAMIKTHTFPQLDNKQQRHTHTHNTERHIHTHTYTQEDKRR